MEEKTEQRNRKWGAWGSQGRFHPKGDSEGVGCEGTWGVSISGDGNSQGQSPQVGVFLRS